MMASTLLFVLCGAFFGGGDGGAVGLLERKVTPLQAIKSVGLSFLGNFIGACWPWRGRSAACVLRGRSATRRKAGQSPYGTGTLPPPPPTSLAHPQHPPASYARRTPPGNPRHCPCRPSRTYGGGGEECCVGPSRRGAVRDTVLDLSEWAGIVDTVLDLSEWACIVHAAWQAVWP
jgi:hypothetical protein